MIWKWVAGIAALPVAAAALAAGIGLMLPRDHVARASRLFAAPPERVAALVREVEAQPRWRRGVKAIEVLEHGPHRVLYVERSRSGAIRYDLEEGAPGRRFRSRIADPDLPFGGFWIVELIPEAGGTRIEIVEHGHVGNPVFRFVSALVLGHDATMRAYLDDLGRALGA